MADEKKPKLSHHTSNREVTGSSDSSESIKTPKSPLVAEVFTDEEFLKANAPVDTAPKPTRPGVPTLSHGSRELFDNAEGYDLLKEKREADILNELDEEYSHIKPNVIPNMNKKIDMTLVRTVFLPRTFENILRQNELLYKNYYSIIKNELLSYQGVTSNMTLKNETFSLDGVVVAEMSFIAHTLCVSLEFKSKTKMRRLKKVVSELDKILISNGTLNLYVRTDQELDRTLDMISVLMEDIKVSKNPDYQEVNFNEFYPYIENGIVSDGKDDDGIPAAVVRTEHQHKSFPIILVLCILFLFLLSLCGIGIILDQYNKRPIEYPVFEVTDARFDELGNPISWSQNENIDVFGNPDYDGSTLLKPGLKGAYTFFLSNNDDLPIRYDIKFSHTNVDGIPMRYKLRMNNVYVKGTDSEGAVDSGYVKLEDLSLQGIIIEANSKVQFMVEWTWYEYDDAQDTEIGRTGVNGYSMSITITAAQEITPNEKD